MSWKTEWDALSNEISGFIEAGHLLFLTTRDSDIERNTAYQKGLKPLAENIYNNIKRFSETYPANIPLTGIRCLEGFLKKFSDYGLKQNWGVITDVQIVVTLLISFRAEFSYYLSDIQFSVRKLTERAFIHLQRSIVVDDALKKQWKDAFDFGETKCEKLGANHLLSHGIWAFKASGEGERTDLILNEALDNSTEIESTASGLVLTEWKVVHNENEIDDKMRKGKAQAKRYGHGILGGFELKDYRYIVIVSGKHIDLKKEEIEDGIIYRYINIAVNPSVPSKK